MNSIDITSAAWIQSGEKSLMTSMIEIALEEGSKITVMSYKLSSNISTGYTIGFYDYDRELISTASGSSGSYSTVPAGTFFIAVTITSEDSWLPTDVFSAIVYIDTIYELPMQLPVSVGKRFHVHETNGERRTYNIEPQESDYKRTLNYSYVISAAGVDEIITEEE